MTENIRRTIEYIKEKFQPESNDSKFVYRYEHSLRVAAIGRQIAEAEGLNEEALTIACLLHDIGYIECFSDEDYDYHGRISERIAKEFLESIAFDKEWIDTICYGIRIHTEEPEKRPTAFEKSIANADNIDRFDAFRLYEGLRIQSIENMSSIEIIEFANARIERLTKNLSHKNGTMIATKMWQDKITYQIDYFKRLKSQMELHIE